MSSLDPGRREQILRAAERLLGHYGPAKTTIADIAREADVGVGTVYLEFPSKDAILEALSTARHDRVLAAMREAATAEGRTYRERMQAVFEVRVETFLSLASVGPHAGDLLHCASTVVKEAHHRFVLEEEALVAELLRRGSSAGELEVDEPEAVATAVLRCYASFTPPWLFHQPADQVRSILARLHQVVLFGLVSRDGRRRR
jgi:AcrR family transcriptional regulator